jgi:hypothetical protein
MRDEARAYDLGDEQSIVREHNQRVLEQEDGPLCANCGHSKEAHWDRYGCEVELGDAWVSHRNGETLMAQGPCGCMDFQAEESQMERDIRCSGSFAEGQARLAADISHLTVLVKPHLEEREGV